MMWAEFKKKWARYSGKESSAYQDHFSEQEQKRTMLFPIRPSRRT